MNKKRSIFTTIWQVLLMDIRLSPGWIALDSGAMFFSAVLYAVATYIKQLLFDTISDVLMGHDTIHHLIFITVAVVLFQFVNELINAICNFTWSPAMRSTGGKIRKKIHEKIAKLSGNVFENVKYLELIEKATMGAESCYTVYNSVATILFFYIPYFGGLGIYLYKLSPILPISILFVLIPMIINLYIRHKISDMQIDLLVPIKRKMDYFESEIYHRDYMKENRLFGLYSFFKKKYEQANDGYVSIKWRAEKKKAIVELGLKAITLIGYLGIIMMIVILLMKGTISVGAFAAVFSSVSTMFAFMNDAVGYHLGSLFDGLATFKRVLDFFDIEEEPNVKEHINWNGELEVRNMSFSYPGTNKKVLDNVSFKIKGNETLAIVGINGAGKSTLVRIILGILKPDSGEVLVDGRNIHDIEPQCRCENTSAVFQKFNKYQMTVKENVQISDAYDDDERFKIALEQGDFQIDEKFDNKYNTVLSKEFGGIELSGGQWQRLAIARGLYRNSDFIVLDEPTSAIDPIEESNLYIKFQQITSDKKAIIVTHRMGSSRLADRIIVLKEGRLVEEGNYEDLMAKGGDFASLYAEQAKWYNQETI